MIGADKLSVLVGDWEGDEELFATAWTAPGRARATLSVGAGPGGGLLIDYAEEREGATMTGHGVLADDGWWWFDSYGFVPRRAGEGRLARRRTDLGAPQRTGRTVAVFALNNRRLEQRIDTAVPADGALVPLLRGIYSRRARPKYAAVRH
jgi:hypothetical protein